MMDRDIQAIAIGAIARQKQLDPASIRPDSSLQELGISSLDAITIVYEIEEELGIEIPNEALDSLGTIQDIVERVSQLIGRSA